MTDGVAEVICRFSGDWRPAPARDAECHLATFRAKLRFSALWSMALEQSKARRAVTGGLNPEWA
jgi:hypothetical protein